MTFGGDYDYSLSPRSLPDLIAMKHDLRYNEMKIAGASGLFTSSAASHADLAFSRDMLKISSMSGVSTGDRFIAGTTGVFIGSIALFKMNRLTP